MVPSQVWSMNWNRPVAEEVFALALGLRLDSRSAVLSRYSKPAPVTRAASRIAPVTRVAISVVAPPVRAPRATRAAGAHGRRLPGRVAPEAARKVDRRVGAHGRALTGRTALLPRRVAGWAGYGK